MESFASDSASAIASMTGGVPASVFHSKSTFGHTFHDSAGRDALASAQLANPAWMSFWIVFMSVLPCEAPCAPVET